jgi:hypothetical protein
MRALKGPRRARSPVHGPPEPDVALRIARRAARRPPRSTAIDEDMHLDVAGEAATGVLAQMEPIPLDGDEEAGTGP